MVQEVCTNGSQALHGLHKCFLSVMGYTLLSAFSVPRRSSLKDPLIVGQVGRGVVLNAPMRIIEPRFLMF